MSTDIDREGIIRYVEDWDSEIDLRDRIASDGFAALSRLIEDASRPPRVQFTLVSGYRRADFLAEVRSGAARAS